MHGVAQARPVCADGIFNHETFSPKRRQSWTKRISPSDGDIISYWERLSQSEHFICYELINYMTLGPNCLFIIKIVY